MKSLAANILVLVGVVAAVAGVAWFRSTRAEPTAGAPVSAAAPSVVNSASSPTTAPAKEGELCPEPPPVATAAETATSSPAVTKKIPRIVDLGADKCIPCKQLAPILEELKKEYAGRVTVDFIDVWKNPKAGAPYNIRLIPTQVFFDQDGKEVWRHEGFLPKADFIAKFAELGVK